MEPWTLGLLNHLDREGISEISQLERRSLIPISILKDLKPKIFALAASNLDLFFNAAMLYYAKFIQSIEVANLSSESALIPQYLKMIEIMKNLNNGEAKEPSINFEPYIRTIIYSIKDILLFFESIEKTFEFLKILKEIEQKFEILIKKEEFEFLDLVIQEYVKNEADLKRSYAAIIKIKEEWDFDLFNAEGSWINKARKILWEENKETCNKNLIKELLIKFNSFTNVYHREIREETIQFCYKFEFDSSEIFNSIPPINEAIEFVHEISAISSDFSPIFDNHLINRRSQLRFVKPPICLQHHHIAVWEGFYLLNLKHICIKEYKGNEKVALSQYNKEANIIENLSKIGSSLYLEHYSNFEDGNSRYIVMEYCKKSLREAISNKESLSRLELANFVYLFIEGLSKLKTDEHIYHRDIKPENIMINNDGKFKLIDWNISVVFDENSIEGLGEHSIVGTLEYCSPEKYELQKSRSQEKFERSLELNDVYSLGLVILELHTLKVIVKNRNVEEAFYKKLDEQISQIEIPWLQILLEKMLAIDWNSRLRFEGLLKLLQSNEEFMNDMNEYENNKRAKSLK